MPALNWGMIQDGGVFESLMHSILSSEDAGIILFGRPGKDAGQDARSADGTAVYQAKYRQAFTMDMALGLAKEELAKIRKYRTPEHPNYQHWRNARQWTLVANLFSNPNDAAKWQTQVVPIFQREGLAAEYWGIEKIENKLAEHPHISDVFFAGENRVLVGLKEAHVLLSAESTNASLEIPMVGREREMREIEAFAESADKRVLPVIGLAGVGKSRLLYEGLVALSQKGWRVLWALPGTMARSSRWFHLLNGSQKTCIAIDNPDDPELLRAIIEQLCTVERRNWKIIISFRTEDAEVLRRFKNNTELAGILNLEPLTEADSKNLLRTLLRVSGEEPWLHNVYSYTSGMPGWLTLIATLANKMSLQALPETVDEIAAVYIDSCINSISSHQFEEVRTLVGWIALWGTMNVNTAGEEQPELRFLESIGLPPSKVRDLLCDLVRIGLVRNWGVGKRLYAVEPMIIREYILSDWLLIKDRNGYRVSTEGMAIIRTLINNEIPAAAKIFSSLSHLTLSRLEALAGFSFLRPIFAAMAEIALDGNVLEQFHIVDLVENAGAADPESALDVLATIRQNPKDDLEVEVPHWGPQIFTSIQLISKLPWCVYQIAEHVYEETVARLYLAEFRELITYEDTVATRPPRGKEARELLKRLLCQSRNSVVFAGPAAQIVESEIEDLASWPFVGLLTESLLNPEREITEYVAKWTLQISIRGFAPGSPEWDIAARIRTRILTLLLECTDTITRSRLWHILAESHQQFHRMIMHGYVKGALVQPYQDVLTTDLSTSADILKCTPVPLTIDEATHAREMWSWYLEYGSKPDLIRLARRCENIYESLSKWKLHEFFSFDTDDEVLLARTDRIAKILREAPDIREFNDFFEQADRYLAATVQGIEQYAFRIAALADALFNQFELNLANPENTLSFLVIDLLGRVDVQRDTQWYFVVFICQKYLVQIKSKNGEAEVDSELRRVIGLTPAKARLVFDLYSNAHPASIGQLTESEFACMLELKNDFSSREFFILLGVFSFVDWETTKAHILGQLEEMGDQLGEASEAFGFFIRNLRTATLRYSYPLNQIPLGWILEVINDFSLDGALLEMHEFKTLRKKSGFHFSMQEMVAFLRVRMALEAQSPRPSRSFKIMPYDFPIDEWCQLSETDPAELSAFSDFCRLALERNFTAVYWMPKYLAKINPSGNLVREFVDQYLHESPSLDPDSLSRLAYLASAYPNSSEAWALIAIPICSRAQNMGRESRERIYFSLSQKETGVITSAPGQVADYYIKSKEDSARMLDSESRGSPLFEYREWAFRRAEAVLKHAEERAEEDARG